MTYIQNIRTYPNRHTYHEIHTYLNNTINTDIMHVQTYTYETYIYKLHTYTTYIHNIHRQHRLHTYIV